MKRIQEIKIKVQRSQAYATLRDAMSYNYQYSAEVPKIQHIDAAWFYTGVSYEGRNKFFKFVREGVKPDFTNEINDIKWWLDQHGHKTGDWAGMVKIYNNDLAFFEGEYMEHAKRFRAVKVLFDIETLPPYALGAFDKEGRGEAHLMPFNRADKFYHTEEGFLIDFPAVFSSL